MPRIVLASQSPRRKDLFDQAGIKHIVYKNTYNEDHALSMKPRKLAEYLSLQKAQQALNKYPHDIIIGADTFVVCNSLILGKPRTKAQAKEMLTALSGNMHTVITGVTVLYMKKKVTDSCLTKVFFNDLTGKEIDKYINTGEPLGKAGAYAIQGKGALLIREIQGDYYNIVGLPLSLLKKQFEKLFGKQALDFFYHK